MEALGCALKRGVFCEGPMEPPSGAALARGVRGFADSG